MAFQKKTWLARLGQGLNKFIFNGGSKVTLDSSPDLVTQEGTPLSAENMNDLEQRIDFEFTNVNSMITSLTTYSTSDETVCGSYNGVPLYRKVYRSSGTGGRTFTIDIDITKVIRMEGCLSYSQWVTTPYYIDASDYWNYYATNTYCLFRGAGSPINNPSVLTLIIEYIK